MKKVIQNCLKNCVLISGTDENLSQKIADHLGLKLAKRTSDTFSDGEVHVQILDDIRGKDVFITYAIIACICALASAYLSKASVMVLYIAGIGLVAYIFHKGGNS